MIQIKRGSSAKWKACKDPLRSGQPGYDKTKHKLKIGDGTSTWEELPDASGLFEKEILSEVSEATSDTLFTYGEAAPSTTTKGKVYLQQYDGAVEADFVVEIGKNSAYFYRKWNSGLFESWGSGKMPSDVKALLKSTLYLTENDNYFEAKGFWK